MESADFRAGMLIVSLEVIFLEVLGEAFIVCVLFLPSFHSRGPRRTKRSHTRAANSSAVSMQLVVTPAGFS